MAALTTEHVFTGSVDKVFAGIRNYDEYPKVLPTVTGIEVLPAKSPASVCQVRYTMKLIKTFQYTLNMFEEKPKRLWWDLDSSNLMKQASGSWTFSDAGGGKTKAVYTLDIQFSGFVPQKMVDQITKANLAALMSGMQKIIDMV